MTWDKTEEAKRNVKKANCEMESAEKEEKLIEFAVITIGRLRDPGANNILLKTELIRQLVAAGIITYEGLAKLENDPEKPVVCADLLDELDRKECDRLAEYYKEMLVEQAAYMDDPDDILRTVKFYNKKGTGRIEAKEFVDLEKSVYDYKITMAEKKLVQILYESRGFEDLRNSYIKGLLLFMETNDIPEEAISKTKRAILFQYYHD